jgi:hypothetical protein
MMAWAAVGMVAGAFVVIWDGAQRIVWDGGRNVGLTIESPQQARAVKYAFCRELEDAHRCRDLTAKGGVRMLYEMSDSQAFDSQKDTDGRFLILVRVSGKESGLKLLYNTFHQIDHHAIVVIELENGEQWVTVLDLPDVQRSTQATIRLPGDARRVRPTPKAER